MGPEVLPRIYRWFSDNCDDGEFCVRDDGTPFSVLFPKSHPAAFIYTTKPQIILRELDRVWIPEWLGLIGVGGLPTTEDWEWIRVLGNNARIYFVGDLDPGDLLVFISLLDRCVPGSVEYVGISDDLNRALSITDDLCISLSPAEREALREFNDYFSSLWPAIGAACKSILDSSRKLELEVTLSCKQSATPVIDSVVSRFASFHKKKTK